MKYLKAQEILPEELIKELQKYASGDLIYVPKPKGTHHGWGELTGSREYMDNRNEDIRQKHINGYDIKALSDEFCLSSDSIKKIIYA